MLIILSKSPWAENYHSIVEIAKKTPENQKRVAVLHIQDACIATTINEYCDKLTKDKIDIYALKTDLEARGLAKKVRPKVKLMDYKQWVKFVMNEHKQIVSWTT